MSSGYAPFNNRTYAFSSFLLKTPRYFQHRYFTSMKRNTTDLASAYFVLENIYYRGRTYWKETFRNSFWSSQCSSLSSYATSTCRQLPTSNSQHNPSSHQFDFLNIDCNTGSIPMFCKSLKAVHCPDQVLSGSRWARLFGTHAAVEPSTSDGLTVHGIMANQWPILDESENDWKSHAAAIAQSIHLIKKRLQWKKLVVRVDLLSAELNRPDVWDDPNHAGNISREHGSLVGKMKDVNANEQDLLEHVDMIKLAREENDAELELECTKALLKVRRSIKQKELEALLSGEQDSCSCYIEVQSGAGGTESMDWAEMVMKMYKLWAQRRGFKVTLVDEMPGEIAGIKRATIKVDGEYAFGYAKAEVGVHRLVRISPFDSGKRRHTSFAAVAVTPILGDGFSRVQINESDLRIERFRAGGAGGQHVNTTESAVRIIHIPTGVTATCQNERSQHQNKASAMAVLQSRLDQLEMARQAQLNAQHSQSLTEIGWGNQIRTYVLHPYRMVKDLRTSYEVSDPDSVLEGDLDGFILSYLSASLDNVD